MNRVLAPASLLVLAFAAAACGSSAGPESMLSAAANTGVVAGCADVQTASTDHQAGDDASAAAALQSAVTAMRKPPVDAAATPTATTIAARLAVGDTAGALSAGSTFCAAHGQ